MWPPLAAPGVGKRLRPDLLPPDVGEGDPEGRLLARDSRGCGCSGGGKSGLLGGLGHPQRVATLDHLLRGVERPHIDQIADVARQFAEEKGSPCILHRRQLQGSKIVPQNGGPGVTANGIIQPFVGHLLVTKAVGSQEELPQLLVRTPTAVGSLASGRTVAISKKGSLDMGQWNFVIDWVMFVVAKVESRQSNQH